jgi:hypothetical protein
VTPEAIEQGLALIRDDKILCTECVEYLKEKRQQERSVSGASLETLVTELRALNRNLTYERFSMWTIVGGIFQGAALFALIVAYLCLFQWKMETQQPILWTMALQLMALSAFIMGRR